MAAAGRSGKTSGTAEELVQEAGALLFASPEPLSDRRLRQLLGNPHPSRLPGVLEGVERELQGSPLPLVLRKIAGGWRLLTDAAYGEVVARLRKEHKPERISAAACSLTVAIRRPQRISNVI